MPLRFLADHCVSNFIVHTLREETHEVIRLRDVMRPESPDHLVIAKASEMEAILLPLNGDFADIVNYPPRDYHGIVALQIRSHPELIPRLCVRLIGYLKLNPEMKQYRGRLFVVEIDRFVFANERLDGFLPSFAGSFCTGF